MTEPREETFVKEHSWHLEKYKDACKNRFPILCLILKKTMKHYKVQNL